MAWDSVADAFRSCRRLGWSPLPLNPNKKKPRFYAWQARCIVPLDDDDLRRLYRPECEIGVACGYGGLVVADVDRGADAARRLLQKMWGPPIAVVLGGRADAFKAIYRGPWAEPSDLLKTYALNLATAGEALARADGNLARARYAGEDSATFAAARKAHTKAEVAKNDAAERFDSALNAWVEVNRLIRSVDTENDEIKLQILSFDRQAVLPPSKHKCGVLYRWEGNAP